MDRLADAPVIRPGPSAFSASRRCNRQRLGLAAGLHGRRPGDGCLGWYPFRSACQVQPQRQPSWLVGSVARLPQDGAVDKPSCRCQRSEQLRRGNGVKAIVAEYVGHQAGARNSLANADRGCSARRHRRRTPASPARSPSEVKHRRLHPAATAATRAFGGRWPATARRAGRLMTKQRPDHDFARDHATEQSGWQRRDRDCPKSRSSRAGPASPTAHRGPDPTAAHARCGRESRRQRDYHARARAA